MSLNCAFPGSLASGLNISGLHTCIATGGLFSFTGGRLVRSCSTRHKKSTGTPLRHRFVFNLGLSFWRVGGGWLL